MYEEKGDVWWYVADTIGSMILVNWSLGKSVCSELFYFLEVQLLSYKSLECISWQVSF